MLSLQTEEHIMAKDNENTVKKVRVVNPSAPFGGAYLVTYIGAAVYFVQQANGFWNTVLALLQAAVWPAYFVHRVFELLHV